MQDIFAELCADAAKLNSENHHGYPAAGSPSGRRVTSSAVVDSLVVLRLQWILPLPSRSLHGVALKFELWLSRWPEGNESTKGNEKTI